MKRDRPCPVCGVRKHYVNEQIEILRDMVDNLRKQLEEAKGGKQDGHTEKTADVSRS